MGVWQTSLVLPKLELATIQKWFDKSANICLALSTEMHSICKFSLAPNGLAKSGCLEHNIRFGDVTKLSFSMNYHQLRNKITPCSAPPSGAEVLDISQN